MVLRVRRFWSLLLLLLMAGCSRPGSTYVPPDEAAPATRAPAAQSGARPVSAAAGELVALCSQRPESESALPLALLSWLQADAVPAPLRSAPPEASCLRVSAPPSAQVPVSLVSMPGGKGAVVWRHEGRWMAEPIRFPASFPDILYALETPMGRELVLNASHGGTGGVGSLLILREEGGRWRPVLQTPEYSRISIKLVGEDRLLVTARNLTTEPLYWDMNCCIPTAYQWLWLREGDSFRLAAERRIPSPYYAINVFLGALRRGDQFWLAQVATPEAIADAQALGVARLTLNTPETLPRHGSVEQHEAATWSLLFEGAVAPNPAESDLLYSTPVVNGDSAHLFLRLRRTGDRWLVDRVRLD